MEEDQEQKKFVCKVCGKSFFSGRSLGGHMRGHLATNSAKKHEDHNDSTTMDLEGDGDDAGYGLRDNPKKSWRVSDAKQSIIATQECHCKECGKEFPSMRALSGHMRCHSIKSRNEHVCKQCGKGFASMKALFGHMRHHTKRSRVESQSDHETACPILTNRSSTRYNINGNFPLPNLNASSLYVSEIDEVEEAAMCLMMLSRGVRNWVEFNSVLEASVMFEPKALHQTKDADDETRKTKKLREKLDSCISCPGISFFEKNESEFDGLDSGFVSKNEKKVELGLSIDGFRKGDEFKKPEPDDASGIESFDVEIENGSEPSGVESEKDLVIVEMKSKSSDEVSFEKSVETNLLLNNSESNSKLEYCNENSIKQIQSLKNKDHECQICFKVFPSGQALGGHKRAHYFGMLSENKIRECVFTKQEFPDIQNVFDLNLQATLEKEINDDDVEFKPWWVGSDHEPEPLVISN